ncbi:uncharacterized protein MONBRDRAFT_25254 [Monosiga brevicollis MX1]|uniref:Uncharacterized protein n=1 Tax=Monosiga brevicollis TaxID=81824 RepID=A9UYV3_MONBE|nr:uncharacterized protein MONBRDRAFT_25254 [Monosiga brevicollis MX1]EDQ89525.1 predicted protein [Monosiga brevicollis MX1]|eukprot:XP_001745554.1 hypothetical protein [Monosiga brevicollis MX1]
MASSSGRRPPAFDSDEYITIATAQALAQGAVQMQCMSIKEARQAGSEGAYLTLDAIQSMARAAFRSGHLRKEEAKKLFNAPRDEGIYIEASTLQSIGQAAVDGGYMTAEQARVLHTSREPLYLEIRSASNKAEDLYLAIGDLRAREDDTAYGFPTEDESRPQQSLYDQLPAGMTQGHYETLPSELATQRSASQSMPGTLKPGRGLFDSNLKTASLTPESIRLSLLQGDLGPLKMALKEENKEKRRRQKELARQQKEQVQKLAREEAEQRRLAQQDAKGKEWAVLMHDRRRQKQQEKALRQAAEEAKNICARRKERKHPSRQKSLSARKASGGV